jgi:hypothetical protein
MSLRLGVARQHGVDETMAAKVDRYESSDLPAHQKVALRLTDAFVSAPGEIDPGLAAEVRLHFTPAQIVELMLDISKWSTQKVPVALGLDGEVNPGGLALFDFGTDGKVMWGPPIAG